MVVSTIRRSLANATPSAGSRPSRGMPGRRGAKPRSPGLPVAALPTPPTRYPCSGWNLVGRAYGVVVHGDVAGVEAHRRNLTDWLDWMGLIDASAGAKLDRYIGYYEPYYSSHEALDKDKSVQEEVSNVARLVVQTVKGLRAGRPSPPDTQIKWPRTK